MGTLTVFCRVALAVFAVAFAALLPGAHGHSTHACWVISGSDVTFYVASYHSLGSFRGRPFGGILLSKKRYNFQHLIKESQIPKNAICSRCPGRVPRTVTYQTVKVSNFVDGTFTFTTTRDGAIEAPWSSCWPRQVVVQGAGPCSPRDKTAPVFSGLPLDMGGIPRTEFGLCSKKFQLPPPIPKLKVFDNCDKNPKLNFVTKNPKSGVYERIWTASDKSGNKREYKQTIVDYCNVAVGGPGLTGKSGKAGDQGVTGVKGVVGENGLEGRDGVQGPRGNPGPLGAKGDKGGPGPAGGNGPQGPAGKPGEAGEKGIVGDDAEDGPQGRIGPPGFHGEPGEVGGRGEKGQRGDTGPQGFRGAKGSRGAIGDPGGKGEMGDTGVKGDPGTHGITTPWPERADAEHKIKLRLARVTRDTKTLEQILYRKQFHDRWDAIVKRPSQSDLSWSVSHLPKEFQPTLEGSEGKFGAGVMKEAYTEFKLDEANPMQVKPGAIGAGLFGMQSEPEAWELPPEEKMQPVRVSLPVATGKLKPVNYQEKDPCPCYPNPPPECPCGPTSAAYAYAEGGIGPYKIG